MNLILISLVALTLGALGNRSWGWEHGSRAVGVFLMTAGFVLTNPTLTLYAPLVAGLVWGFRFTGTGETWLAWQEGRNRMQAILRGAAILPLGVFMTFMTNEFWHIVVATCFPVIAAFYHIAGKTKAKDPTMYAELLTGAYVVAVCV